MNKLYGCQTRAKELVGGSPRRSSLLVGLVTLLAFVLPVLPAKADCNAFMKRLLERSDITDPSIYVTIVTLNNKNVASFGQTRLYYRPGSKRPNLPSIPDRFVTLAANQNGVDNPKFDYALEAQVFSDRIRLPNSLPQPNVPNQPRIQRFDPLQADDLAFEITFTSPVQVTITLLSWGNVKDSFTPTCESGGFMLGSVHDAKYTLRLKPWPPNSPDE